MPVSNPQPGYAETHAAAINNADKAVIQVSFSDGYHGKHAEITEHTYRRALIYAHHTILNMESTIDRLRGLIEEQRDQLETYAAPDATVTIDGRTWRIDRKTGVTT